MKSICLHAGAAWMIAGILAGAVEHARADEFSLLVQVECQPAQQQLVISFVRDMPAKEAAQPQMIDPYKLIHMTQLDETGDKFDWNFRSKTLRCKLGRHAYTVRVAPSVAAGWSPTGECAARVGASVRVFLGKREVASMGNHGCADEDPVTVQALVRPGKEPVYTEADSNAIYFK